MRASFTENYELITDNFFISGSSSYCVIIVQPLTANFYPKNISQMTNSVSNIRYNIDDEGRGLPRVQMMGGIRMNEDRMKEAEELHLAGKTKEAFPIFKEEAEKGNGRALYFLAEYYKWRLGGREANWELAESLDQDGKGAGDVLAALNMAYFMENGSEEQEKVFHDMAPAVRKLAEKGDWAAQDELADLYLGGYGVRRDLKKAMKWAEKSAAQGYWRAMTALGNMYRTSGLPKEAAEWYEKSGKAGDDWGWYNLGDMYLDGRGMEKDEEKAFSCYEKALALEGPAWDSAACSLGAIYYGRGDYKKANTWYRKAAKENNDWAMFNLGDAYRDGTGVKQNTETALKWYKKAYSLGGESKAESANRIGLIYESMGDEETALSWYEESGAEGCDWGWYNLGLYYQNKKACDAAVSAFLMSWEIHGEAAGDTANRIGLLYGSLEENEKAADWFEKAGKKGNGWGWYNLGSIARDAGEDEKALKAFTNAYETAGGPKGDAANQIALIYEDRNDRENMEKWYILSGQNGFDWGWYNLGVSRMHDQKWKEAFALFKKVYDMGTGLKGEAANRAAMACYHLGNMEDALDWASKASEEGSEWGFLTLGFIYDHQGKTAEALRWYRKAYEAEGDAKGTAAEKMADLYNKEGKKDEALRWYRQEGAAGSDRGWYMVAESYFNRHDTEESLTKAAFYYELAYKAGGETAAMAATYRGITACKLDNYEEGNEWYEKAIQAESDLAAYLLAGNAFKGLGMKRDLKLAESSYHVVLESDLDNHFKGDSCCRLGDMEKEGGNMETAFYWYQKAADYDHDEGWYCLGLALEMGEGTERNSEKALEAFRKGYELDHDFKGPIATAIGLLYNGKEDFEEAHKWFDLAAQAGDDEGAYNLAAEFRYGIGIEADPDIARNLYEQLSDHAEEEIAGKAREALEEMDQEK